MGDKRSSKQEVSHIISIFPVFPMQVRHVQFALLFVMLHAQSLGGQVYQDAAFSTTSQWEHLWVNRACPTACVPNYQLTPEFTKHWPIWNIELYSHSSVMINSHQRVPLLATSGTLFRSCIATFVIITLLIIHCPSSWVPRQMISYSVILTTLIQWSHCSTRLVHRHIQLPQQGSCHLGDVFRVTFSPVSEEQWSPHTNSSMLIL